MIEVTIDYTAVNRALARVVEKLSDLTPVMNNAGNALITSVEENIRQGGRYGSGSDTVTGGTEKWLPLSAKTIKQRRKKGYWPGKILQQTGALASTLSKTATALSLVVGVNKPYAAIHQYGGWTGRNHKAWIPPRPYMVVQEEDVEEIKSALVAFLNQE